MATANRRRGLGRRTTVRFRLAATWRFRFRYSFFVGYVGRVFYPLLARKLQRRDWNGAPSHVLKPFRKIVNGDNVANGDDDDDDDDDDSDDDGGDDAT